jgi:hypothetical protein
MIEETWFNFWQQKTCYSSLKSAVYLGDPSTLIRAQWWLFHQTPSGRGQGVELNTVFAAI